MIRIVLIGLTSLSLFAQLGGRVVDAQGRVVADASVHLLRQAGGESWRTETDAKGAFVFERMAAGDLLCC